MYQRQGETKERQGRQRLWSCLKDKLQPRERVAARVAEPCHFDAAPAPTPAPEPAYFFLLTYLLHAWVSWGPIRPEGVVFILPTYFWIVHCRYRYILSTV